MKTKFFPMLTVLLFTAFVMEAASVRADERACQICCNTNNSSPTESDKFLAKVGHPAPEFSLEAVINTATGQEFKSLNLQDFRGKWLVLFFYPSDFTSVCPTEIKGFNDSVDIFNKLNAEILAVSTDSKWSHRAWIKSGELGNVKYPLLSDITKETSCRYGVLDKVAGVALRGLFLIDPNGVIQYQVVHNMDIGRSVDETIRVLEALQTGGMCPLGWKHGQKTLQDKTGKTILK